MSEYMKAAGLSDIDPGLLEEALRRAMKLPAHQNLDPHSVLSAIFAEARAGTRHLYGLVSGSARRIALN